jgi:hypothetical protein
VQQHWLLSLYRVWPSVNLQQLPQLLLGALQASSSSSSSTRVTLSCWLLGVLGLWQHAGQLSTVLVWHD